MKIINLFIILLMLLGCEGVPFFSDLLEEPEKEAVVKEVAEEEEEVEEVEEVEEEELEPLVKVPKKKLLKKKRKKD